MEGWSDVEEKRRLRQPKNNSERHRKGDDGQAERDHNGWEEDVKNKRAAKGEAGLWKRHELQISGRRSNGEDEEQHRTGARVVEEAGDQRQSAGEWELS